MEYVLLRKNSKGGGLRNNPPSTVYLKNRQRTIILVHGFNKSECEAENNLKLFQDNLFKLDSSLSDDVVALYWPGDSRSSFIKAAFYPWIVKKAKKSGKMLAEYLKEKGPCKKKSHLIFVGHSLGCRVLLEALADLVNYTSISDHCCVSLFLMAAAVPVELINSSVSIQEGIKMTHHRNAVFFSNSDQVLKIAFRIGQTIASEEKTSEAVGLNGKPMYGVWNNQIPMLQYGHGDYWDSYEMAQWIAYFLGSPVPLPVKVHSAPIHRTIVYRPTIMERVVSKIRRIGR